MTPWSLARGAMPATLLVYFVETAAAALAATPVTAALLGAVADHPAGEQALSDPGHLWLAEALRVQAAPLASSWWTMALGALLVVLLRPWLALTWLHALHGRTRLWTAATRALGELHAAAGVWGVHATVALLGLGMAGGGAYLLHASLVEYPNPAVQDVLAASAGAPGLLAVVASFVWHDLALARLTAGAPLRTAMRWACRALRESRLWIAFVGFTAAGWIWLLLGLSIDVAGPKDGGLAVVWLLVQPTLLLGKLVLRSRWLATAVLHAASTEKHL